MSLKCKLIGCSCISTSDEKACWGECIRCGARHGYLERKYIRRNIEAEEAYKMTWKKFTLEGMTP